MNNTYNNLAGFLQEELKRKVNREADIEYHSSNSGELRQIKREKVVPLSAGLWNMCRQFLP